MSNTAPVVGARRLEQLEQVIQRGLGTFVEVGAALLEIRDGRLYREAHATFEDYCRERWGFSKSRANQLVAAAEVVTGMATIVAIPPPTNEGQARELARITDPAERARIWQEVTEEHGDKVTAADIRRAAALAPPLLSIVDLTTGEIIDPEDEEEEASWHERRAPIARRPEQFEVKRQTPQDIALVGAKNLRIVLERTRDEMRRDLTWLETIDYGQLDAGIQDEWRGCLEFIRGLASELEERLV